MPRITRKQQKVFAVDAQNNGVFGSLQANDPVYSQDPDVIQSRTAYSNGWDDATYSSELLPPLEEFQGLQYLFSRQLSYVFQEGVPEWETNTTYYTGSICKTISGTRVMMFLSLVDNNQGNLTSDTTKWYMFFDSDSPYAMDNDVVHKSGNETISGNKTFTGANTFSGNNTLTGNNTFTGTNTLNKGTINYVIDATLGTTPPGQKSAAYGVIDNNGNWMGGWESYVNADGAHGKSIAVRDPHGSTDYAVFGIWYNWNGSQFVQASTGVSSSIVTWGMPNYSTVIGISSGYIAPSNGIVRFFYKESVSCSVTIGGQTPFAHTWGGGDFGNQTFMDWLPIAKGQQITFSGIESCYFETCYGG